mmetsp:Transcript_14164/g.34437  ORF Transcript_14164/g.34437 Transcript_14164/m.34437 type:complete len:855 (-) Transcript_14164:38-2602(-)
MRITCSLAFGVALSAATRQSGATETIALVVNKLRKMLKDSEEEGDNERKLYAKFKCYCDTNEAEKVKAIAEAAELISETKADTSTLRAENGKLSVEKADMEQQLDDAQTALKQATNMRAKENKHYQDEKSFIETSIGSLENAIEVLSEVGGDQTAAAAADHDGQMAGDATAEAKAFLKKTGGSLVSLSNQVKKALTAATVALPPKDRKKVMSFISAPGGDYSAASGEIVGILKNMHDTFKENLANTEEAERRSLANFNEFKALKEKEIETLEDGIEDRENSIGDKAGSVQTNMQTLEQTESDKAADEEFLTDLRQQCADKKAQYEERNKIRADEAAAISQAVAILNGDEAFDTFAAATEGGVFVQIKEHSGTDEQMRKSLAKDLRRLAAHQSSLRIAKVAMMLRAGNPFDKILEEIDKVIARIEKEGDADEEKKEWCVDERAHNNEVISNATTSITSLEGQKGLLETDIGSLTDVIDETNADIQSFKEAMADETKSRRAAYLEYNKEMRTLVATTKVVDNAIKTLKKFYEWLARRDGPHTYGTNAESPETCTANKDAGGGNYKRMPDASKEELEAACSDDPKCSGFFKFAASTGGWLKSVIAPEHEWYDADGELCVKVYSSSSLLQSKNKEDPAPPSTFDKEFEGQKSAGAQVIETLETLKSDTNTEMMTETEQEETDQADFEAFMTDTTADMQRAKEQVADAEAMKAQKKQQLADTIEDLENTRKVKADAETYLEKIKPDCDFMMDNIEGRKTARAAEISNLETAIEKIKGSPVYKKAKAKGEKEAEGKCANKCFKMCDQAAVDDGKCFKSALGTPLDERQADGYAPCEACRRGITVAAFCTGEGQGNPGCPE